VNDATLTAAAARTAVREIYADLEDRPRQRNCTGVADCCRFRLTGRTPYLTRGEALVAAAAWRAAGRVELRDTRDGSCPMLGADGRCGIYADRPFGCRTHFCAAAGGPLARGEVRDLIQRLEDIDHRLGGCGAVNLPAAVRQALAGDHRKSRR
jgi:Fe-S-cluster containining protein